MKEIAGVVSTSLDEHLPRYMKQDYLTATVIANDYFYRGHWFQYPDIYKM